MINYSLKPAPEKSWSFSIFKKLPEDNNAEIMQTGRRDAKSIIEGVANRSGSIVSGLFDVYSNKLNNHIRKYETCWPEFHGLIVETWEKFQKNKRDSICKNIENFASSLAHLASASQATERATTVTFVTLAGNYDQFSSVGATCKILNYLGELLLQTTQGMVTRDLNVAFPNALFETMRKQGDIKRDIESNTSTVTARMKENTMRFEKLTEILKCFSRK